MVPIDSPCPAVLIRPRTVVCPPVKCCDDSQSTSSYSSKAIESHELCNELLLPRKQRVAKLHSIPRGVYSVPSLQATRQQVQKSNSLQCHAYALILHARPRTVPISNSRRERMVTPIHVPNEVSHEEICTEISTNDIANLETILEQKGWQRESTPTLTCKTVQFRWRQFPLRTLFANCYNIPTEAAAN